MMSSTANGGGPSRTTSYARDGLGRVTVETDATSRTTTYTYNSAGLVATEKDLSNSRMTPIG